MTGPSYSCHIQLQCFLSSCFAVCQSRHFHVLRDALGVCGPLHPQGGVRDSVSWDKIWGNATCLWGARAPPWRGVNAPWWRNAPCGNDGVSRQSGPRVGACSSLGTASGCFCLLGRRDPGTRTEGKWRASEAYARGRSDEAACVPAARLNQRGRDPRRDRSSAELRTFFLPHLSSSEWTTAAPLHRTGKQGAPVRSAWPRRVRGAKTQAALGLRARSPRLPQAPSLPHFTPRGAVPWRPP